MVQLVKESSDLEDLERRLNDPDLGINNLDLNADGQVDYLRVVSHHEGDTLVVILQAVLDADEYQDVATIQIDRDESGEVELQVQGDVAIYGRDYYVVPVVHVHTWPLVQWYYGPHFYVWVSPFHWHHHPHGWRPWGVVSYSVYRPRVTRYTTINVNVTRVNHVTRAGGVYRTRTTSTRVVRPTRETVGTRSVKQETGVGKPGTGAQRTTITKKESERRATAAKKKKAPAKAKKKPKKKTKAKAKKKKKKGKPKP